MIWRGIFQQFTFRGDNGQLFGERVRYPMNMFLFTIYFCMGYTGYFIVWRVVCSRACVLPEKFLACPLMKTGRPHLVVNRSEEPEKMMSGQLKPHVSPLLQVHNHMLIEFLVETFRWVKLLVSTGYYQLLCSDYGWHYSSRAGERRRRSHHAFYYCLYRMVKLWLVSRLNVRQ